MKTCPTWRCHLFELKITVSNETVSVSVEINYPLNAAQVVDLKTEMTKLLEKIGEIRELT
jgi:hypothetical protein